MNRKLIVATLVAMVILILAPGSARMESASPTAPLGQTGSVLNWDPDPYEPDNTCAQAKQAQKAANDSSDIYDHTFHTSADVDWMYFDGPPSEWQWRVSANDDRGLFGHVLIEVYRDDCRTLVASGAIIDMTNRGGGRFYFKMTPVDGWVGPYVFNISTLERLVCLSGHVYRTGTQVGIANAGIWVGNYTNFTQDYMTVGETVSAADGAWSVCQHMSDWDIVIARFQVVETNPPGCVSTGRALNGVMLPPTIYSSELDVVDWEYGGHNAVHGPFTADFYDTPPLVLGGVTPMAGQSCPGQVQQFVTSVTDVEAASHINLVEYVFDAGAWLQDAVYLSYDQTTNLISLRNDAGTGWLGGYAPGSAQVPENSRVRVPLTQCQVGASPDGKTLLVTWALAFKSDFAGTYNQFLYARHQSGYYQGFEDVGDWTVNYCGTPTPTLTPTITPTPPPGGSGEASFQEGVGGYGGCQDTTLDPWYANQNHGSEGSLIVRANNSFSSLLRYELTSLPTYAVINEATLSLYADSWQTTAETKTSLTVGVYEVLRDWAAGQATWANALTGVPWGVPGCSSTTSDRAAVAADEALVNALGQWYDFDLTALVQKWVQNPASNHGIVLKSFSSPAGVLFRSADHGGMAQRPKLVIEYTITAAATPTATATPTRTPTQGAYPPPRTVTPTHWTHLPLLLKNRV